MARVSYSFSFFLAMGVSSLFFFALLSLTPILPLYALKVGATEAGWGATITLVAVTAAFLRLIGGSLSDRLGRRLVMVVGALAIALGGLTLLLTDDFLGLLLGRALHGIGIGAFTTAYRALIVDLAPESMRGEAVGLGNLTFAISLIVASPFGEWVQRYYGFDRAFIFSIGIALFCALAVNLIRFSGQSLAQQSILAGARDVLPRPSTQIGIWGMLGIAATFIALITFLPLLADTRGIGGVGFALSAYSITQLIGQPLGGRLGDRLGWRLIIIPGMVLTALGVFFFLIARGQGFLFLGAACIGLGSAVARVGLDLIVLGGAPPELRGTASGWEYASFDLWNGVLSWLLGAIVVRTSYEVIYAIMALIPLAGAILLWFVIPRNLRYVGHISLAGPDASQG